MDSHDAERVALLSIKPDYATAIFAGRKTVEFRRSRIAPDIGLAFVYATLPVGQVIGWFRIDDVVESTPDGLWRQHRHDGAIRRRDYFAYFVDAVRAYGIRIAEATPLHDPVALDDLCLGLRAPQSFQYLPKESVLRIFDQPPPTARLRMLQQGFA